MAPLLLCLSLCHAQTQHAGKPAGWRPDKPPEEGGAIVHRMMRRVKSAGATPGPFFERYFTSMQAMQAGHEALRPATLKSEDTTTTIDEEMQEKLEGITAAFEWQHELVAVLEAAPHKDEPVSRWPIAAIDDLLDAVGGVVNASAALSSKKRVATASDLLKLLRIFEWQFASMPDDDEAKKISRQDNLAAGYGPPSQPPPPPPRAPGPGPGPGTGPGGMTKRIKKKQKRRKRPRERGIDHEEL